LRAASSSACFLSFNSSAFSFLRRSLSSRALRCSSRNGGLINGNLKLNNTFQFCFFFFALLKFQATFLELAHWLFNRCLFSGSFGGVGNFFSGGQATFALLLFLEFLNGIDY
jgi:hypothetical protein